MSDTTTPIDWRHVAATALGVLAGVVAAAGTVAVAVAGFTLSYDAIRKVGIAAGVRPDWAWLLPVSVDGAMAVATVTAVVMSRMCRNVAYPWAVVITGAVISIACNGVHARMRDHIALDDWTAMAVSAIPALMLVLSVHLLVVLVVAAAQALARRDGEAAAPVEAAPIAPVVSQPVAPVSATPASRSDTACDSDTTPAATPVAPVVTAPAARPRHTAAAKRRATATTRTETPRDIARRRVAANETCATVALSLGVDKRTVERWTQDIREARQRPTATAAGDSDDTEERVG